MMKITLTEEGFGKDFAAKNIAVSLWLVCFCVFQLWLPLYCIWQHDCVCVCFWKVQGQSGVKVLGQSPVWWGFMVMIHSFKNPCWWLGFITFMNDTRVGWCCAIEYADAVGGREGRWLSVMLVIPHYSETSWIISPVFITRIGLAAFTLLVLMPQLNDGEENINFYLRHLLEVSQTMWSLTLWVCVVVVFSTI